MKKQSNLHQVAAEAGVSTATASRVLGDGAARKLCSLATIERVETAARKLGYRANYHMRSVRNGCSNLIGFSYENPALHRSNRTGTWYFGQIIEGIESACQKNGKILLVVRPDETRPSLERGLDYLQDRRLDGLVLLRHYIQHASPLLNERDPKRELNIVSVDGPGGFHYPHIGFNIEAGLGFIARHLRELGHRRVLWFGPQDKVRIEEEDRELVFLRQAFSLGMSGELLLVDRNPNSVITIEESLTLLETCFREGFPPPEKRNMTAVVCYNDTYAVAAQRMLLSLGLRIPQDVSLTGFDDSTSVFGNPPITTVNHMLYEMGCEAGQVAIDFATHKPSTPPASMIVEPQPIFRASTGPCPV